MRIEILKHEHKDQLLMLLKKKFKKSYQEYPELPKKFIETDELEGMVDWMLTHHSGYAAVDSIEGEDQVVSFIHNMFIDELFYSRKGVFTAEWGHYFDADDPKTLIELLTKTYEDMLLGGYEDHAISVMNDLSKLQMVLFDNAYGSRCMDANYLLKDRCHVELDGLTIEEGSTEDLKDLIRLLDEHHSYMNKAPSLLGFGYDDSETLLNNWLTEEAVIIWVLKDKGHVSGMMKTVKGQAGGCDVTYDALTVGIETTQLDVKYRGRGLAKEMVNHVINYAIDHSFTRLAVDYETHNPSAQYFWPKVFTPTVRSLIRNIGKKST